MASAKIVYQLNDQGYLVGETLAHQSPLEPGVFLLPGGCIENHPPAIPEGFRARWTNDEWVLEPIPAPPEPEPIPEVSLTSLQKAEAWIASSFSIFQLLQMKDWWDTIPHENLPKLSAVYVWIRTVTQLAANTEEVFPPSPYTFEEVFAESIPQLSN